MGRKGQQRDRAMELQDGGKGKMDAWNPMGAREREREIEREGRERNDAGTQR